MVALRTVRPFLFELVRRVSCSLAVQVFCSHGNLVCFLSQHYSEGHVHDLMPKVI